MVSTVERKWYHPTTWTEGGRRGLERRNQVQEILANTSVDAEGKLAEAFEKASKARADRLVAAELRRHEAGISREIKNIAKPGLMERIGERGVFGFAKDSAMKNAKIAGIGLAVIAGVGTAAALFRSRSKEKTRSDIADAQLAAASVDTSMIGAPTLMGQMPTPGALAAREEQRRGGLSGPAGLGAS